MSHSKCKALDNLLKEIIKKGFIVTVNGNNIRIVPPVKNKEMYLAHYSHKGYHPIRRYVKQFSIDQKLNK